ncbi:hypothetical protein V2K16_22595 [Pseudomonas alliivorans]|uniref:hypothetical protein n=1 Tax=Pseudomonas alliivorans TaxID=2810613 RepID=UPI001AEAB1E4|nr:hypothetical protein [Pseudomonas alliivorans]MBP0943069.1 hypothetical protein [Pseudomonas alliivorans]MEE4881165.1 hypothetical protein [Pseudomonas alliivorans]MEE4932469.1 hypothetical protein [Pseudomonas alliivorans]MEE4937932.1 hypothetical protein [Pseudomonas alliivorans]MEE4943135.1 hypothetical protein [Pseudomonas alliivorans]
MKFNKVLDGLIYHPDATAFAKALKLSGDNERQCLAELWLSEGIPMAFVKSPTAYQVLRMTLAQSLNVGVKDVSLVGSGRLGFSLAPKKYGEPFGEGSDLDVCIISDDLFQRLIGDSDKFIKDFNAGELKAASEFEHNCWSSNVLVLGRNANRGFIDAKYVPNYPDRYKNIFIVNKAVCSMNQRMKSLPDMPKLKRSSVRVYRDWGAMSKQVAVNLEGLAKKLCD